MKYRTTITALAVAGTLAVAGCGGSSATSASDLAQKMGQYGTVSALSHPYPDVTTFGFQGAYDSGSTRVIVCKDENAAEKWLKSSQTQAAMDNGMPGTSNERAERFGNVVLLMGDGASDSDIKAVLES